MGKKTNLLILATWAAVSVGGALSACGEASPAPPASASTVMPTPQEPGLGHDEPVRRFDRGARSTRDPASPWVVVNKRLPMTPAGFDPDLAIVDQHLVARGMAQGLEAMLRAAESAGAPLHVASAYRSPAYQRQVYEAIVARDGQELADRWSARPGHSEHQTGWAVDLDSLAHPECRITACFGDLAEGRWLRDHAREFGFLVRYTREDQSVTGYAAEPWHVRYVGRRLAREMHRRGITTLEEFFDLPGGDYLDSGEVH